MKKDHTKYEKPPWLKMLLEPTSEEIEDQITIIGRPAPMPEGNGNNRATIVVAGGPIGEYTGTGDDDVINPNKPVETIHTDDGTKMLHEGEIKIVADDGRFAIIPAKDVPQPLLAQLEVSKTIIEPKSDMEGYKCGKKHGMDGYGYGKRGRMEGYKCGKSHKMGGYQDGKEMGGYQLGTPISIETPKDELFGGVNTSEYTEDLKRKRSEVTPLSQLAPKTEEPRDNNPTGLVPKSPIRGVEAPSINEGGSGTKRAKTMGDPVSYTSPSFAPAPIMAPRTGNVVTTTGGDALIEPPKPPTSITSGDSLIVDPKPTEPLIRPADKQVVSTTGDANIVQAPSPLLMRPPDQIDTDTEDENGQSGEDSNIDFVGKRYRDMAEGDDPVSRNIANQYITELRGAQAAERMALQQRISNDPNLTEGAKRALMGDLQQSQDIQEGDMMASLATNAIQRADSALDNLYKFGVDREDVDSRLANEDWERALRFYDPATPEGKAELDRIWTENGWGTPPDMNVMVEERNYAKALRDQNIQSGELGLEAQEVSIDSARTALGDQQFNSVQTRIDAGVPYMVNGQVNPEYIDQNGQPLIDQETYDAMKGEATYDRNLNAFNYLMSQPGAANKEEAKRIWEEELFPGVAFDVSQVITDENAENFGIVMNEMTAFNSTAYDMDLSDVPDAQVKNWANTMGLTVDEFREQYGPVWNAMNVKEIDKQWGEIKDSEWYQGLDPEGQAQIDFSFTAALTGELDFYLVDEYEVKDAEGNVVYVAFGEEDAQAYLANNPNQNLTYRATGDKIPQYREIGRRTGGGGEPNDPNKPYSDEEWNNNMSYKERLEAYLSSIPEHRLPTDPGAMVAIEEEWNAFGMPQTWYMKEHPDEFKPEGPVLPEEPTLEERLGDNYSLVKANKDAGKQYNPADYDFNDDGISDVSEAEYNSITATSQGNGQGKTIVDRSYDLYKGGDIDKSGVISTIEASGTADDYRKYGDELGLWEAGVPSGSNLYRNLVSSTQSVAAPQGVPMAYLLKGPIPQPGSEAAENYDPKTAKGPLLTDNNELAIGKVFSWPSSDVHLVLTGQEDVTVPEYEAEGILESIAKFIDDLDTSFDGSKPFTFRDVETGDLYYLNNLGYPVLDLTDKPLIEQDDMPRVTTRQVGRSR